MIPLADVPQVFKLNPEPVAHVAKCRTHSCWGRVRRKRRLHAAWRWVKTHPMPYCTWVGESSPPRDYSGPYSMRRYRMINTLGSTASGKFMILDTTWRDNGGGWYRRVYQAAAAPPLEQERVARRILRRGGLSQWANC